MTRFQSVGENVLVPVNEQMRVGKSIVIDEHMGATAEEVANIFNAVPELVKELAQMPSIAKESRSSSR